MKHKKISGKKIRECGGGDLKTEGKKPILKEVGWFEKPVAKLRPAADTRFAFDPAPIVLMKNA